MSMYVTKIKGDKRAIIWGSSIQIVGAVIAGVAPFLIYSLEFLLLSCVLGGIAAGYLAKESNFLVVGYVASLAGLVIFGLFSFAFDVIAIIANMKVISFPFNLFTAENILVTLATTFWLALLGGIGGGIGRLVRPLDTKQFVVVLLAVGILGPMIIAVVGPPPLTGRCNPTGIGAKGTYIDLEKAEPTQQQLENIHPVEYGNLTQEEKRIVLSAIRKDGYTECEESKAMNSLVNKSKEKLVTQCEQYNDGDEPLYVCETVFVRYNGSLYQMELMIADQEYSSQSLEFNSSEDS